MEAYNLEEQTLIEKVRLLPPEKMAEVFDFVEFLHHKASSFELVKSASQLSEQSFSKVWDNALDAEYDKL